MRERSDSRRGQDQLCCESPFAYLATDRRWGEDRSDHPMISVWTNAEGATHFRQLDRGTGQSTDLGYWQPHQVQYFQSRTHGGSNHGKRLSGPLRAAAELAIEDFFPVRAEVFDEDVLDGLVVFVAAIEPPGGPSWR